MSFMVSARSLLKLVPGLAPVYRLARATVRRAHSARRVREFKTSTWQSPEMTAAFVQATDAATSATAAVMDAVVNQFFLKHCPPQSKVLDLGAGHGIVSTFLARHGHSVTACDVSERMLQIL